MPATDSAATKSIAARCASRKERLRTHAQPVNPPAAISAKPTTTNRTKPKCTTRIVSARTPGSPFSPRPGAQARLRLRAGARDRRTTRSTSPRRGVRSKPASSIASRLWMPTRPTALVNDPFGYGVPERAAYSARRTSADLKVPSGRRLSLKNDSRHRECGRPQGRSTRTRPICARRPSRPAHVHGSPRCMPTKSCRPRLRGCRLEARRRRFRHHVGFRMIVLQHFASRRRALRPRRGEPVLEHHQRRTQMRRPARRRPRLLRPVDTRGAELRHERRCVGQRVTPVLPVGGPERCDRRA